MQNIVYNLNKIEHVVDQILDFTETRLICFYGDLGAGKTTLIKALLKELGGMDAGNSPTFGLVSEYWDTGGRLLAYHLDCYRLESEEEALDLGIEEYLDADCWVFVEWPERIEGLLPLQRTEIRIKPNGADGRELILGSVTL